MSVHAMVQRFRSAGLVWPTLLALTALVVLIGLGSWQMQRKSWKDGLVRQIMERSTQPPVPLAPALVGLGDQAEYVRVTATGRFLHGQERHLFIGPGYRVITPLVTADGAVVLVNRGFVPDQLKQPESRGEGLISGDISVTGLVRQGERPGTFTPHNDGARNMWFWRDVEAMSRCWSAPPANVECRALEGASRRYPFMIDALAEPLPPGGWPRGGTTNLTIPNRHLEYAVTWFGLAATLVGVFIAFAAGKLRGN